MHLAYGEHDRDGRLQPARQDRRASISPAPSRSWSRRRACATARARSPMSPRCWAWKARSSPCRISSSTRSPARTHKAASPAGTASPDCAPASGTRALLRQGARSRRGHGGGQCLIWPPIPPLLIYGIAGLAAIAFLLLGFGIYAAVTAPQARLKRRISSVVGDPLPALAIPGTGRRDPERRRQAQEADPGPPEACGRSAPEAPRLADPRTAGLRRPEDLAAEIRPLCRCSAAP